MNHDLRATPRVVDLLDFRRRRTRPRLVFAAPRPAPAPCRPLTSREIAHREAMLRCLLERRRMADAPPVD